MPTRVYWACQGLAWSLHSGLNLLFASLRGEVSRPVVLTIVAGGVLALAASDRMRVVIHRRNWLDERLITLLPRVAALAASAAAVVTALQWAVALVFHGTPVADIQPAWLLASLIIWMLAFILWAAVYLSGAYFRRLQQAEAEKLQLAMAGRDAELQALRAQLNPHFLFNALNGLRSMIVQEPARAQDMVTSLSELLRYSLQSSRRSKVPLAEEIAAIENYLGLEQTRFERRLAYDLNIAPETLSCEIPPMLLQTLVENAMKHGIARRPEGGRIIVQSHCDRLHLHLSIRNPGPLDARLAGTGLGLENARRRLRLLYGDAARLDLATTEHSDVLATVVLPRS